MIFVMTTLDFVPKLQHSTDILNTCCQLAGMLICSTFCVLQLSVPSENVMWSWLSSCVKQPFNLTVYMEMSYFALCSLLDCHHICLYSPASLN